MTTLVALLNHLVAVVPDLDWLHASWFVNDTFGFLGYPALMVGVAMEWVDRIPIVGDVLVRPFFDLYVLLGVQLAFLGALLTFLVMVGSGMLHALVESRVNDLMNFFDTLQQFARLVRGS